MSRVEGSACARVSASELGDFSDTLRVVSILDMSGMVYDCHL